MTTKEKAEPTLLHKRLNTDRMVVDKRYQRKLNEHRVEAIARGFDVRQLGVLEISKRKNGTYSVIDGQHRLAALKALGRKTAPCVIHEGLEPTDEAELFVRHQLDRRSPTAVERFKAQVFYGAQPQVDIQNIVVGCGFRIENSVAGDIKSVVAIERVYKNHGPQALKDALLTIRELWYGDRHSVDGQIITGMATFLSGYGDRFNSVHKERLAAISPVVLIRRAFANGSGGGRANLRVADEIRKFTGIRGKAKKAAAS